MAALTLAMVACGSKPPAAIVVVEKPPIVRDVSIKDETRVPDPPPPPPDPSTYSVPDMIVTAFSPLGPGAVQWALRVARCESGYNPSAMNPSGDATGVFQFLRSTWALTPWASYSRTDAWANVQAGAWLYTHGGPGNWVCR